MKNYLSVFAVISTVTIFLGCHDEATTSDNAPAPLPQTPVISYAVTNTYPHDNSLFTEGLLFHEGKLYESTGSPEDMEDAKSVIVTDDLKTGTSDQKVEIDGKKYFGEGIVFLNGKIYQLTYKNKLGFIYDAKTFKRLGTFTYTNTEGWSLTTDGKYIIMSDGTENLTYLDPENLKPVKTLTVTENGFPIQKLNELEYIKGFIYANIWTTNYIVNIDPANGKVVGKLDLTSLTNEARNKNPDIDVLNGIAYDSTTNKILVTGKLWNNIYQIDFAH